MCAFCLQLPDKSIGCLVKYYYSWKKTRSRTSLIDRQANKIANSRDVRSVDFAIFCAAIDGHLLGSFND